VGLTESEPLKYIYLNAADLLKRLNQENCPKCRKMIKTSNNIYLVYEEFPLLNLKEHLTKNHPNRYESTFFLTQDWN
jgi:hypothetical protein